MRCPWNELLSILPPRLRTEVDRQGRNELLELRLRLYDPVLLVLPGGNRELPTQTAREDLDFAVNAASRYSPWNAVTASQGYLTAPGGHRVGLCGDAVMKNGVFTGLRQVTSLCIRVARDFPGIAGQFPGDPGSVLIIGAPGWGKTTLLRDLIRKISNQPHPVSVVDERGELFPPGTAFPPGRSTDVLNGCPKPKGIEMLLRTMSPRYLAVDEITAQEDTQALCHAAYCGVNLLATAHAGSLRDFYARQVYRPLVDSGIFTMAAVLRPDRTYKLERMEL